MNTITFEGYDFNIRIRRGHRHSDRSTDYRSIALKCRLSLTVWVSIQVPVHTVLPFEGHALV